MGKIYQFLFIYFIRKTPEKWGKLRNYFVRKYIKSAGKNMNIGRYCKMHKITTRGDHSGGGCGCGIRYGVAVGRGVVWGARVCILPGETIGQGAVIGACAVVSKDVPAYSVAVGNPARVVKKRKS